MKSKLTITVASILSVLVLVGVGFAAWVISNPDVNREAESSITAETVSDKSYTLEAQITNGEIVFGAPATMDTPNAWLTAGKDTQTEDRTATLTLTLKYKDWNYVPLNFSVFMKSKKTTVGDDAVFSDLVGKKYITNPKISYNNSKTNSETATEVVMNGTSPVQISKDAFAQSTSNAKDETTEKTATLEITITFGWGEYFKVDNAIVNPYVYYNGKDYENFHVDANDVLTALHGLNNVKYVVTISGTTNKPGVSET